VRALRALGSRAGVAGFRSTLRRAGADRAGAEMLLEALRAPDFSRRGSPAATWLSPAAISRRLQRGPPPRRVEVLVGPHRSGRGRARRSEIALAMGTRLFALGSVREACVECLRLSWIHRDPVLTHAALQAIRGGRCVCCWSRSREPFLRAALNALSGNGLRGRRRWLWGSWRTLELRSGRLGPQPGCPRCWREALNRAPPPNGGVDPAARALQRLKAADLGYRERGVAVPSAFRGLSAVHAQSRILVEEGPQAALRLVEAKHFGTGEVATAKTLTARAEAIERLSCNLRRPDVWSTPWPRVRGPFLPPDEWALYAQAQYRQAGFPYRPVTRHLPLDWLCAEDLATGETQWVPSQLFFTQLYGSTVPILQVTSNGAASHTDREKALSSALLEAIERDAFQRAWHGGSRPKRLSPSRVVSADLAPAESWLNERGWSLHLRYAPAAGAHVVIAGAQTRLRQLGVEAGGALFSAAASGSLRRAADHALRELLMFMEAVPEVMSRPLPDLAVMKRTQDLGDAWRLYLRPEMRPLIEWFLDGVEADMPDPLHGDELSSIVEQLRSRRIKVLAVEMTAPLFAPFRTVQVYLPGLLPLTVGTDFARVGSVWRPDSPSRWPTEGFAPPQPGYNPFPLPFA
jgi:thiazole/oxazole-forming peptide maturase SagD family component